VAAAIVPVGVSLQASGAEQPEPPAPPSKPNMDAYLLWLAKHQVNVSRKLILSLDPTTKRLSVVVKWKVLNAHIDRLRNVALTRINKTIAVGRMSVDELAKLLRPLGLTVKDVQALLKGKTIVRDLGTSIEVMTTADDPPHWCDWGYPTPLWAYSYSYDPACTDEICTIYFIAEDPINLIFKLYPPSGYDEFTFIHEELKDSDDVVDDQNTEDDWPPPELLGVRIEHDFYVYDCYNSMWKKQDRSWVEGDEQGGPGNDLSDRMHIRVWKIYSPVYGYAIVGSVHLEVSNPDHDVLSNSTNYTYGYEQAEHIFVYEFLQDKLGPWWVAWDLNKNPPLIVTNSETFANSYGEVISSFYVYLDNDWSTYGAVYLDYVDLGNSELEECYYWITDYVIGKEEGYYCSGTIIKYVGDGKATYIYYQAPSAPR
jgi:hypothetical protein